MADSRYRVYVTVGLVCAAVVLAMGCACPLSRSVRERANRDISLSQVRREVDEYAGATVIWGGIVLKCINDENQSELVVLETPLGPSCRPEDADESRGRFVARSDEFLDPEVYLKDRKVVVGGEVIGSESRPVGKAHYTYPVVKIQDVHVFAPEATKYRRTYPDTIIWHHGFYHYRW